MRASAPSAPRESATAPRLEIVRVGTPEDQAAALAIRRRVFSEEQHVAELQVSDSDDARSLIGLAKVWTLLDGEWQSRPVATGRLTLSPFRGGQAQIAWVATLPDARRRGIGSQLLRFLLAAADEAGAREVVLAAQAHAERFYLRLGFHPAGPLYDVRGIPHLKMVRRRPN